METGFWFLLANLASTWYMVGLIWMVQLVHYPLFAKVGTEDYTDYQRLHQRWTTLAVGPPMLVEAFSSVLLLWFLPTGVSLRWMTAGIVLVFVIWGSTGLLQVPCHGKLEQGFDRKVHRRLVNSNWIRTIAWSLRGVLTLVLLWQFCRGF